MAPLFFSEQRNQQFFCGECGTRILVPQPRTAEMIIPRHQIPAEVHEYRKKLEKDRP